MNLLSEQSVALCRSLVWQVPQAESLGLTCADSYPSKLCQAQLWAGGVGSKDTGPPMKIKDLSCNTNKMWSPRGGERS